MLVVVDTNVLVSGLLTADSSAPTARIAEAMLRGSIRFALSVELLGEYREVLQRPRISKAHGHSPDEVDELLVLVAQNALVIQATTPALVPADPGDVHLAALLAARPDATLVTGDTALLADPATAARSLTPAAFVALTLPPE